MVTERTTGFDYQLSKETEMPHYEDDVIVASNATTSHKYFNGQSTRRQDDHHPIMAPSHPDGNDASSSTSSFSVRGSLTSEFSSGNLNATALDSYQEPQNHHIRKIHAEIRSLQRRLDGHSGSSSEAVTSEENEDGTCSEDKEHSEQTEADDSASIVALRNERIENSVILDGDTADSADNSYFFKAPKLKYGSNKTSNASLEVQPSRTVRLIRDLTIASTINNLDSEDMRHPVELSGDSWDSLFLEQPSASPDTHSLSEIDGGKKKQNSKRTSRKLASVLFSQDNTRRPESPLNTHTGRAGHHIKNKQGSMTRDVCSSGLDSRNLGSGDKRGSASGTVPVRIYNIFSGVDGIYPNRRHDRYRRKKVTLENLGCDFGPNKKKSKESKWSRGCIIA